MSAGSWNMDRLALSIKALRLNLFLKIFIISNLKKNYVSLINFPSEFIIPFWNN